MRLARAFDARETDEGERFIARLGTAVAKYWVAKRGPAQVNEALECLGGNGYVEESVLPRLYREAPLNSIWEGSGNVICLDILRAMDKEPEALTSLLSEIRLARGSDRRFDAYTKILEKDLREPAVEVEARLLAERLALAFQASLLIRHSIPEVADAFCAARLGDEGGRAFGTLAPSTNFEAILNRAFEG
jgi:putative acyl-CoA dehydrogenase